MIKEKHVISSLPLVASVLGRKYGVRVHIGGDNAYTNGKDIHLPSLPADGDATLLNLARGYLDHESAHIRETSFTAVKRANLSPLEKYIWNCIEDWRVEHKLASLFPGCGQNFKWLIKHLFIDANLTGQTRPPGLLILDWILTFIRSWSVPELALQCDCMAKVIERHFPGLLQNLQSLVETIPTRCHSTTEAITVAREIVRILENYCSLPPEQLAQDRASNQAIQTSSDKHINAKAELDKLLNAASSDLPQDIASTIAERLGANASHDKRITVATVSTKHIWELNEQRLQSVRQATNALRVRLQGLLQSQVYKPSQTGYRGRLDTHCLHKLTTGSSKLFCRKNCRTGINTAVHILLDISGSMHGHVLELACKSCYATADALRLIPGVSTAVTAFPGEKTKDAYGGTRQTVAPILTPGQHFHKRFVTHAGGSTPMDAALWWVMVQMQTQPQTRKLVLAITDGEPDLPEATATAISAAINQGIEVYGVGIDNGAILKLLPQSSKVIHNINELPKTMFSLLQKALLKASA